MQRKQPPPIEHPAESVCVGAGAATQCLHLKIRFGFIARNFLCSNRSPRHPTCKYTRVNILYICTTSLALSATVDSSCWLLVASCFFPARRCTSPNVFALQLDTCMIFSIYTSVTPHVVHIAALGYALLYSHCHDVSFICFILVSRCLYVGWLCVLFWLCHTRNVYPIPRCFDLILLDFFSFALLICWSTLATITDVSSEL